MHVFLVRSWGGGSAEHFKIFLKQLLFFNCCFAIVVLQLCVAIVFCNCVLQLCFAIACCNCVLQLCVASVFCNCVMQLCVELDEKPKKS